MPVIKVFTRSGNTYTFDLDPEKERFSIGRSQENDIVILDNLVSRVHAEFGKIGDSYSVTDLESFNGVSVNDLKINSCIIEHNDKIKIGSAELTFLYDAKSAIAAELDDKGDQRILAAMKSESTAEVPLFVGTVREKKDECTGDLQEMEKSNKILFVLYRISRELNQESNLDELLNTIMEMIFQVIDADYGFVALLGKTPEEIIPKAVKCRDADQYDIKRLVLSKTIVDKVVREKLSVLSADATKDSQFNGAKSIIKRNIRSVMSVPLLRKENVIGMIQIVSFSPDKQFNKTSLSFLNTIGGQIAMLIERVELNEKIRRKEKQAFENLKFMLEERQKSAEEIRALNTSLERKVVERTRKLNESLEKVRNANRQMMDSIRYAEKIQRSLLPNPDEINRVLPDSFYIWMPRELVGGDIVHAEFMPGTVILAVIDCTGHGIPGAFMTMIASSGLKRIIREEGQTDPALILRHLNFFVKTTLQQDTSHSSSDDGLDAAIVSIEFEETAGEFPETLTFAGARLPLTYIEGGEAHVIKGNRQSIGYKRCGLDYNYTNHTVKIEKGMRFYMYTDGFVDQLGGAKEIHFGRKRMANLLRELSASPFDEQKDGLLLAFEEYKGEQERQDDVAVVGFGFD